MMSHDDQRLAIGREVDVGGGKMGELEKWDNSLEASGLGAFG